MIIDEDMVGGASQPVLVSLLYVSSGNRIFTDEQLVDYLRSWRDHNEEHKITGFLLYENGNFMQVLEGQEADIDRLVALIQADTRHRGMIILWKKGISQREFGEWCMGFRKASELTPEDQRTFSSLLENANQDEKFRNHPGASHRMLAQFKSVCLPQYDL